MSSIILTLGAICRASTEITASRLTSRTAAKVLVRVP